MNLLFPVCRTILVFTFLIALTGRVVAADAPIAHQPPARYVVEMKPPVGLKPFEYTESAPLPNYVPSTEWGKQGEPIRTMQKPLDPVESMKHLVTLPDFKISLFAAEPEIFKPLWISWDERGRTWIAETLDYPNELQPEGAGRDRLSILEDTNPRLIMSQLKTLSGKRVSSNIFRLMVSNGKRTPRQVSLISREFFLLPRLCQANEPFMRELSQLAVAEAALMLI